MLRPLLLATTLLLLPVLAGAQTLVVLNKSGASASLLDPATGEERARVPTGVGPHEAAVSPDGRLAVVADYGQAEAGHTLTVVDIEAAEVVRTIDIAPHGRPHGIVYQPDGEHVVVTAEASQSLLTVHVGTGTVVQAVPTGARVSHMVATSTDGSRAWVANIGSGSVTVADLATGERIAEIPTGEGAEGIDLHPQGHELWVSNRGADTISVLDTASGNVLATLPCASFPIRLKFTPDGARALVSCARSGDLAVFDAPERTELARIPMLDDAVEGADERLFDGFEGPVPVGILVEPAGRRAYVANTNADTITLVDLDTLAVVGRFDAGPEPDGMAWSHLPRPGVQED